MRCFSSPFGSAVQDDPFSALAIVQNACIDSQKCKGYNVRVNQAYYAGYFTARDVFRFSASVAFLVVAAFFFSNTGHAQTGRPPQQASDPSGYRLIGTMESSPLAGAVISDSSGTQSFYRLHERLPDGSQVVKVRSDSISLKRSDGTSFNLYFRGSNPGNQQNRPPAAAAAPPAVVQETRPAYEQPPPAKLIPEDASAGQRRSKSKLRRRNHEPKE